MHAIVTYVRTCMYTYVRTYVHGVHSKYSIMHYYALQTVATEDFLDCNIINILVNYLISFSLHGSERYTRHGCNHNALFTTLKSTQPVPGLHLRILARGAYCEIYNLRGGASSVRKHTAM